MARAWYEEGSSRQWWKEARRTSEEASVEYVRVAGIQTSQIERPAVPVYRGVHHASVGSKLELEGF